jgi:hypothetical protein
MCWLRFQAAHVPGHYLIAKGREVELSLALVSLVSAIHGFKWGPTTKPQNQPK